MEESSEKEASVQKLDGLSTENKALVARLLAVYDSPSEFMKCICAVELWGISMSKDPVARVMASCKDIIATWNPTDKKAKVNLPKVPDLTRDDTHFVRWIWNNRDQAELLPNHLREVAKFARKLSFENYRIILNRDRTMLLEC